MPSEAVMVAQLHRRRHGAGHASKSTILLSLTFLGRTFNAILPEASGIT